MLFPLSFQALHCRHLSAIGVDRQHEARVHRLAVEKHCARPTVPCPASRFRPGQPELVPQHLQQRLVGFHLQRVLDAIHLESDRKSTRLNSSHSQISYAVFCLKKKTKLKTMSITTAFFYTPVLDM